MNNSRTDLHIHTRVSDGTADAITMLKAAQKAGVQQVSITDHDAVGAYRHFHPDLFGLARSIGLDLISGIELDTDYLGLEVHLLGYGIDIDASELNEHLTLTQGRRRERVTRQIEAVNAHFGRIVIDPKQVILPERDTLMKPHLVHGLLETGLWGNDYREAQKWLSTTINVGIEVPKLPINRAIALVHAAGGRAVLAHPGFLSAEHGLNLEQIFSDLTKFGLDGVEVEYAYAGASKFFPDRCSETAVIENIRNLANRFSLFCTRGSDAHDPERLIEFANRSNAVDLNDS